MRRGYEGPAHTPVPMESTRADRRPRANARKIAEEERLLNPPKRVRASPEQQIVRQSKKLRETIPQDVDGGEGEQ